MTADKVDGERFGAGDLTVRVVEVDIVVAARLHLDEVELHLLLAEAVDVDKLGVVLGELAGDDVAERVRRIERGENGDAEEDGVVMELDIVGDGVDVRLARVDDIVDLALVHELRDLLGRFQPVDDGDVDAEVGDDLRGARRCIQRAAEVGELLGDGDDLELILIVDGEVDAHRLVVRGMAHLEARGDEPFEERLFERFADAEHFARRLHFGAELRVDVVELFKAENGHLDGDVRRIGIEPRAVAEVAQAGADHDLGGKLHHGNARHLGDIRDGARCAGVDFDDVELVLVDEVLDVDEPLGLQGDRKLRRDVHHRFEHGVAQMIGRIDRDGVARVHARALDVLHDAGDEHVHTVRNGVHFELGAHEVLIAEHGVFDVLGEDDVHIAGDVVLREGDRHVLPADDVRRAQEHGIAERFRRLDRLLLRHDREALGTGDIELFEKLVEALAILCPVDAVGARAEDGHARLIEIAAQLDGGLPAEGDDDAVGLFDVDDVLHVFGGQRLEIKPVRRVEVGGDRLGVVVDDDDFVAELFERPHAVDGGVVELDALPDADGARADDDDALFLALIDEGLGFVVV